MFFQNVTIFVNVIICFFLIFGISKGCNQLGRNDVKLPEVTCSKEDVLLPACANKGYQVVYIHNRYFIVFLCVNTRDTRLYFYHKYFIVFCVHFWGKNYLDS